MVGTVGHTEAFNGAHAVRPVVTASGEHGRDTADKMPLDSIAVVLDLMDPALTFRHARLERRETGSMKPGNGAGLAPGSVRAMKRAGDRWVDVRFVTGCFANGVAPSPVWVDKC
jgi:hypothetical protein